MFFLDHCRIGKKKQPYGDKDAGNNKQQSPESRQKRIKDAHDINRKNMFQNTANSILKPDIFPRRIPKGQFDKGYLGYGQSQQHEESAEKVGDEQKIQRTVIPEKNSW